MTHVGKTLYDLQQIDLTLRKNEDRLDAIRTELAHHQPVKRAQRRVDSLEVKRKPLQTELRDLELQSQATKQKRESSEQRLYSGAVSNPKELQDIEQNIEALKRWQSELDEKQLELMMRIEAIDADLAQAQATLDDVTEQAAINNQDLLAERQRLISESEALRADRDEVITQLTQDHVALYQQMQSNTAFRPIAILNDDYTCSICGVQQTRIHAQHIRQSSNLERCANCNRILIAM
ncbi:MAG: zinc ribbon domain-containing protein [Anaerolineae bacterium]